MSEHEHRSKSLDPNAARRFQVLAESALDLVAEVDLEGRVTYASPSHEEVLGRSPEALVGQRVFEFIHPDDRAGVARSLRAGAGARSARAAFRFRHRDGHWVWFETTGQAYRTAGGEIRAVVLSRDVSERQRAEQELARSTESLTLLGHVADAALRELDRFQVARHALDAIAAYVPYAALTIQTERESGGLLELLAARGFEKLPGRMHGANDPPGRLATLAMRERRVVTSLDPETQVMPRYRKMIRDSGIQTLIVIPLLSRDEVHGVLTLSALERRELSVEERGNLLAACATVAAALANAQHVERLEAAVREREAAEKALRESQAQLLQSQKMEALGLMAGGISHDFNNLLTVITGYAEMLREEALEAQPDFSGIEEILQAADRAMGLTRQLLTFSRKQVLQPRLLDLNAVIEDLETMLRRVLGETIQLDVRQGCPHGVVRADPGQISQIIVNLAVNARDAMPTGGTLCITTQEVLHTRPEVLQGGALEPGPHVRLVVEDSGIGMEAATLERIFEPFFTTKDPGRGTGLGLSTVYGIVRQSQGQIRAKSQPGSGTRFEIDLPRAAQRLEPETAAAPPPGEVHRGGETLLVVEDEAEVRGLVRRVLHSRGYRVVEAGDGHEALALVDRLGPELALVISDVVMPDLSGPELARRIALRYPETPVLYMSGYPEGSTRQLSNLPPTEGFLAKPFSPAALAQRVREMLDS